MEEVNPENYSQDEYFMIMEYLESNKIKQLPDFKEFEFDMAVNVNVHDEVSYLLHMISCRSGT